MDIIDMQDNRLRNGVKLMADRQPSWAGALLEKAWQEYNGEHILPGTGAVPYYVGNPPKWREQPVTDKEYVWCLNRMYHWNDFILAYYLTEEKGFGSKIKEELLDWIGECPPPPITPEEELARERFDAVTPWRTLEVGIRMFEVWPNAIKFLRSEGFLEADDIKTIALSVRQHGDVLRNIPPMLWPEADHNHYLMENLGLLYLSTLYPDFALPSEWSVHANEQIIRCADVQLSKDGAQIEGCPTYHNLCMDFFCRWIILSQETGITVPKRCQMLIEQGLDYSLASFRPGGGCVPWGDSDADYGAVRSAVLGYRAFHKDRWLIGLREMTGMERLMKELAAYMMEADGENLWEVLSVGCLPADLPVFSFQRQINQVSYRTSWDKNACQIHFGCQMPNGNGHAHIDPLSFDFSAFGSPLLADPGRFTYDEANDRELFKSPQMHNCLLIDHQPPYKYLSSWRFGKQRDGCIIRAEQEKDYFWAQGMHTCYFPCIHQRLVSIIKEKFLLVWDRLSHVERGSTVSIYFHVDAGTLYPGRNPGDYMTMRKEEADLYVRSLSGLAGSILPGYVSTLIDVKHPSNRICYEGKVLSEGCEYITLAVPFAKEPPVIKQSSLYYENKESCIDICVNEECFSLRWDGENFRAFATTDIHGE